MFGSGLPALGRINPRRSRGEWLYKSDRPAVATGLCDKAGKAECLARDGQGFQPTQGQHVTPL